MRRSGLVIGILAVALAACSACDPLSGTASSAPAAPSASSPVSSSTSSSTSGGGGGGGDDEAAFCAMAKEKGAQNLETFDAQSSTPEQEQQMLANIDSLAAAAPAEIHADFALFDTFEHELMNAGGNATGDLAQQAGGQELRNALTHVGAYLDKHCGIHP